MCVDIAMLFPIYLSSFICIMYLLSSSTPTYGHVDPCGYEVEVIVAEAEAAELLAGDVRQREAEGRLEQAGLCKQ